MRKGSAMPSDSTLAAQLEPNSMPTYSTEREESEASELASLEAEFAEADKWAEAQELPEHLKMK